MIVFESRRVLRLGIVALLSLASSVSLLTSTAFAEPQAGMLTDFHRYYPQRSVAYAEFTPSDNLIRRVFNAVYNSADADKQAKMPSPDESIARYHQNFKNEIAFGVWCDTKMVKPIVKKIAPVKGKKPVAVPPAKPVEKLVCSRLGVIEMQDGMSLDTLYKSSVPVAAEVTPGFLDPAKYKPVVRNGVKLLKPLKTGDSILGLDGTHLLFGNTEDVVLEGLRQKQESTSILDNELYTAYLDKLPKARQGTALYSLQYFSSKLPLLTRMAPKPGSKLKALPELTQISEFITQIATAFPGGIASFQYDDTGLVQIDTLGAVRLSDIRNPEFQADLKALLSKQTDITILAKQLPKNTFYYTSMSGFGPYYDLISKNLPLKNLGVGNPQGMFSSIGLDFRKNVIALLDNNIAFAASFDQTIQMWGFLNHTPDTELTMDKALAVASLSKSMTVEKETLPNGATLTGISSEKMPFTFAFAPLDPTYYVLGSKNGLKQINAFSAIPKSGLDTHPLFQMLTATLPQNALSFVYFNYQEFKPMLTRPNLPGGVSDTLKQKADSLKMPAIAKKPINEKTRLQLARFFSGLEGFAISSEYNEADSMVEGVIQIKLFPYHPEKPASL